MAVSFDRLKINDPDKASVSDYHTDNSSSVTSVWWCGKASVSDYHTDNSGVWVCAHEN
jgi:hypothetical protein